MSWRLRWSVETILRLTPAVLGSTVFSIAARGQQRLVVEARVGGAQKSTLGRPEPSYQMTRGYAEERALSSRGRRTCEAAYCTRQMLRWHWRWHWHWR
jgi:hypothetical protein